MYEVCTEKYAFERENNDQFLWKGVEALTTMIFYASITFNFLICKT